MRKINIGNLPQKKELPDLPIDKTKKYLSVEDDKMSWDEVSAGSATDQAKLYLTSINSEVSDSDITAPQYKKIDYTFEPTETEIQRTAQANSSPKRIYKYLYDVGIGTTQLKEGTWTAKIYCKVDNTDGSTKILAKPFIRKADGTERILFDGESKPIKNTNYDYVELTYSHHAETVDPTDRLGVEFLMETTRTSPTQLKVIVGDGYASFVTIPAELRHNQLRGLNEDPNFQHITQAEKDNIVKRTGNASFPIGSGLSDSRPLLINTLTGSVSYAVAISLPQIEPSMIFGHSLENGSPRYFASRNISPNFTGSDVNEIAYFKGGHLGSATPPTLPDHYTRKGYVDTTIQTLIDTIVGED